MNKVHTRKCFYILTLLTFLFTGCVETSDVSLDTGKPAVVVEGKIVNGEGPFIVQLSFSTAFYANSPVYVEDAVLKISDDAGNFETMRYMGAGKYSTQAISGIPGRTYHLEVNYQGMKYEAWSEMPDIPVVDSMEVAYYHESILREEGYYIVLKGIDTEIASGYYRAIIYEKDSLYNPLGTNDLFAAIVEKEGKGIGKIDVPIAFEKGDTVRMEIIKMDEAAYVFYQSYLLLLSNDGGLFGAPPSNPQGNISNGAIGLFQAVSISNYEVIIE